MEEDVYEEVKTKIPYVVGVLTPSKNIYRELEVVKKAKRIDRVRPLHEMLLMMFRSANRDRSCNL